MVQASCQAQVSRPSVAARPIAASITWCSASNQASACVVSVRCSGSVPVGGVGAVQVVAEQPVPGRPALRWADEGLGLFGGVGAQQVVTRQPVQSMLGEQVRGGQLTQRGPRLV